MKKKKAEASEGKKFLIYLVILLCFLGGMYLLTNFLVSKNRRLESTKVDNGSVSIQYTEILLGEVFHQSEEEYLVLCYDKKEEASSYSSIVSAVTKANKIKLYTVDLGNAFNRKLIQENSNPSPTKASEIKVKGATIMHFKHQSITSYIEGKDAIEEYVKEYEE